MDPIAEIKSRLSIADVVGKYVQLKKAGRNFKALCPFHQEKTPSFMVSPEKDLAYCFGCHRGGDIFKFVREMERIDFVEALRLLADQAGVTLPERIVTEKKGKRDLLKALHRDAAEYYEKKLWESKEGSDALSYLLKKRKFSKEIVRQFNFGWSPEQGKELIQVLLEKNYSREEIVESGIGMSRSIGGEVKDRFYGRVVVPIRDSYGDIVAFGGRILADGREPKYLNSPETPLYEKGNLLFALDRAKETLKRNDRAVLVEGYMDVIRAHEAGITEVIGTCGTALTGNQIRIVKRFTKNVVFFFDGDEAGKQATFRAFEPAASEEVMIRVLRPAKELDPDDWIHADAKEVKSALDGAPLFFDFLWSEISSQFDLAKIDEQKKALAEVFPFLSKVASRMEQDQYLQALARLCHVQPKILYGEFNRFQGTSLKVRETFEKRISPFVTSEYLLGCFLQYPETWEWAKNQVSDEDFEGDQNRLYRSIKDIYNTARKPDDDVFLLIPEEIRERARLLALFSEAQNGELSYDEIFQEVKRATEKFLGEKRQEKKRLLLGNLREAETSRDHRTVEKVLAEYQTLLWPKS